MDNIARGLAIQAKAVRPSAYTGQVATSCRIPYSFFATNKQINCRSAHYMRAPGGVTAVRLVFPNFYVVGGGAETGSGATATIAASIEYPIGTFTQATFSGSASGSIPNGGYIVSDAVNVAIPEGARFHVRSFFQSSGGIIYCDKGLRDLAAGEANAFAASGLSDLTMGGTITPNGGSEAIYYPAAIIGQTTAPSVVFFGDSRVAGQTDQARSTDKGCLDRPFGPKLAYINMGVPSDKAASAATSNTNRVAIGKYCSHGILQLGINDCTAGTAAATTETNLTTIRNLFPASMQWFQTTKEPVASTTDNFLTVANQTTNSNNAIRTALNAWVRGFPTGFVGYFELADVIETARDSGLWRVDPAGVNANWFTTDGVHANTAGLLEIERLRAVNAGAFSRT